MTTKSSPANGPEEINAFTARFQTIKEQYESKARRDRELICKVGFYTGCPVLKLQKASWTNDDMQTVPNQTGVFFSIWIDPESFKKSRVKYNIHALKMRHLAGYKITSIDFARKFRKRFDRKIWPNVRIDYGPQTLMQGWIPRVEKTLERDLLALMRRFGKVSPVIDELLKSRR